jgi:hypothetical protein
MLLFQSHELLFPKIDVIRAGPLTDSIGEVTIVAIDRIKIGTCGDHHERESQCGSCRFQKILLHLNLPPSNCDLCRKASAE